MSDAFTADLPELARLVDRLAAFDRIVEAAATSVDTRVGDLASTWAGAAATSFTSAQARWRADLVTMRAAVQRLHDRLATTHGNYTAAVQANAAMWRAWC